MNENYIVTKSNELVCSYYTLSLHEHKIILALISMIQPNDDELKEYKFMVKDFLKLLDIKDKTKYKLIPKLAKGLMQKVFTIKNLTTKKDLHIAWLSSAEYDNNTGTIALKFDSKLKPYLLMLKSYYTTYKLSNILQLKSKYSIRVFEILKRYENKKNAVSNVTLKLDELKNMLGANAKTYNVYNDFKKKCILPAQKELKQYTDIYFDFEEIKTSRKVDSIKFNILKNKNVGQIELDLNTNTEEKNKKEIQKVIRDFNSLYDGNLDYKLIKNLVKIKGIDCVKTCVSEFKNFVVTPTKSKVHSMILLKNMEHLKPM